MYQLTRGQLLDLKDEIKHLLKRMVKLYGEENIRVLMLQDYPLINVYEMMMKLIKNYKNKLQRHHKLCNFLMIHPNFDKISYVFLICFLFTFLFFFHKCHFVVSNMINYDQWYFYLVTILYHCIFLFVNILNMTASLRIYWCLLI